MVQLVERSTVRVREVPEEAPLELPNGFVDLTDVIYTLDFLFVGDEAPVCLDAMDSNDDATVDLSDAARTLGFLFLGKEAPPAPFSRCGAGARRDAQGCTRFDACTSQRPVPTNPSEGRL